MSENDPSVLVRQMLEAAQKATAYLEGFDYQTFLADTRTQEAVAMNLLIIGETVAKLTARHPDFLTGRPHVPWRQIHGMRNRIAHGYSDLDMSVIWETVQKSLPEFVKSLSNSGEAGTV